MGSARCSDWQARSTNSRGVPEGSGLPTLPGLGTAVGAVTLHAQEGAIHKGHGLVAHGTVRRFLPRKGAQQVEVQLIVGFVSHDIPRPA